MFWSRSNVKIGRWSDVSHNISPLTERLFILFVKIVSSISVAVLELILVERVTSGINILEYIISKNSPVISWQWWFIWVRSFGMIRIRINDPRSLRSWSVDQMNWWILVQNGFIGSFDLPWFEWSRFGSLILIGIISKEGTLSLDFNHLKHSKSCFRWRYLRAANPDYS